MPHNQPAGEFQELFYELILFFVNLSAFEVWWLYF
jgi:hypothetical protein